MYRTFLKKWENAHVLGPKIAILYILAISRTSKGIKLRFRVRNRSKKNAIFHKYGHDRFTKSQIFVIFHTFSRCFKTTMLNDTREAILISKYDEKMIHGRPVIEWRDPKRAHMPSYIERLYHENGP